MLAEMVTQFASFRARWWTYRQLVSSLFVSIASIREFKVSALQDTLLDRVVTFWNGTTSCFFSLALLYPWRNTQNEVLYNISSYLRCLLQIFMHLSFHWPQTSSKWNANYIVDILVVAELFSQCSSEIYRQYQDRGMRNCLKLLFFNEQLVKLSALGNWSVPFMINSYLCPLIHKEKVGQIR